MPDWKNEEDYAYTDTNTIERWAWEFLRRNPDYRKEWEQELEKFDQGESVNQRYIDQQKAGISQPFWNIGDPTKDDFVILSDYNQWGLVHYVNPDLARPVNLAFWQQRSPIEYAPGKSEESCEVMIGVPPNSVGAIIDLERPIAPQLEILRKTINSIQEEYKIKPRKLKTSFDKRRGKKYLRCIDAVSQGVRPQEAARVIFPNPPNNDTSERLWAETRRQAMNIVNKGYKDLIQSMIRK